MKNCTRIAVLAVIALVVAALAGSAWLGLLPLAGFCSNAPMAPKLVGLLCSDLMNCVGLRRGVLSLASAGEIPPTRRATSSAWRQTRWRTA